MPFTRKSFLRLGPVVVVFLVGAVAAGCNAGGGAAAGGAGTDGAAGTNHPQSAGLRCGDTTRPFYYLMAGNGTASLVEGTAGEALETFQPLSSVGAATSFSISPATPAGVSFDTTTGILSGAPTTMARNDSIFTITMNYLAAGVPARATCDFSYELSLMTASGMWMATEPMTTTRSGPVAVTLASGSVFVAGGTVGGNPLRTAEIYDGSIFTASAHTMSRYNAATATLLQDGRVLLAGGFSTPAGNSVQLALEIYDPIADTFAPTGTQLTRPPKAAVLLNNGKVLFLEGASACDNFGSLTQYTAQIFDPADNSVARLAFNGGSVGTRLQNGKVLVRGYEGCLNDGIFGAFTNAYGGAAGIFDPTGGTLTVTGSSYTFASGAGPTPRPGLVLANGKVFSSDYYAGGPMNFMQVYDPVAQTFTNDTRADGVDDGVPVRVLADGRVLLSSPGALRFNAYDTASKTLSNAGSMIYAHGADAATVVLLNGDPLVVGHGDTGPSNAEFFTP